MTFINKYKKALMNLPKEIIEAEVNAERKECTLIGVSCGKVALTDVSHITSLYIRASGTKTGYAYTQDLNEDPEKMLLKAYNNGLVSDSNNIDRLNTPETAYNCNLHNAPDVKNGDGCETAFNITKEEFDAKNEALAAAENYDREVVNNKTSAIIDKALMLERLVLEVDSSIKNVLASVRVDTYQSRVINSKGVDVSFTRNVFYAQVKVMADFVCGPTNLQFSVSATSLNELDVESLLTRIKTSAINQFRTCDLASGEYPVVLDRTVGINIMMTAWQLFSGLKYCDGSTALKNKLGEYIGSPAFSVVDVPHHSATGYCFPFDCEGTPGTEVALVKSGKFTGLMHNLSSAIQQDAEPTGNAGRVALLTGNIPTDIIVTPKICCIKPGSRSTDELLQDMCDGVYITESYDIFHSINIGSGDFAIPCRGIVIKDGRPHHSVTALTICGNLIDLFNNVIETGNDLLIDEFLLKSYCVGSPSIRLSKLQINGK